MRNEWASPAGFTERPKPVRYRILDPKTGEVVVRKTESLRDSGRGAYFLSLHSEDQEFAGEIVKLVQQACGYFYLPDEKYEPLEGGVFDWCGECGHERGVHGQSRCALCWAEYAKRDVFEHDYRPHAVSDDEVRERIHRLDKGENTREAERTAKKAYPITELPWDQQRALIEQVERLKHEWCFSFVGEADE